MLTIEIHGLGMEDAEGMRQDIFNSVLSIEWMKREIFTVGICNCNITNYEGEVKSQLRIFTSYSKMQNLLILGQLTKFNLPIQLVDICVFEGDA